MTENRWDVDENSNGITEADMAARRMFFGGLVIVCIIAGVASVLLQRWHPIAPLAEPQAAVEPEPDPAEAVRIAHEPRTPQELADDIDRDGGAVMTELEWEMFQIMQRQRAQTPDNLTPVLADDGCYYWTFGGRRYQTATLEEGVTYGGGNHQRFKFTDGVMEVVETD